LRFFSNLHPIVLFTHFISVLGIIMFSMNPALIAVSFAGAVVFALSSEGVKAVRKTFLFAGFFILIVALTNPLFTHNGVTTLFFAFGRAYTKEALLYGTAAGFMLASVFIWCRTYTNVITPDKFVYLFGKALPKLSLVLSMSLRFIPLFVRKVRSVSEVQSTMGLYSGESLADRFFSGARVFSSVLTWSLENAIDTANSMKARGYGIPGRSSFSLFRFTKKDALMLGLITGSAACSYGVLAAGLLDYSYYPALQSFGVGTFSCAGMIAVSFVMFLPSAVETTERILWKFYTSRI